MATKQSVNTEQMYRNIWQTLRSLISHPIREWQNIHRNSATLNDMLGNYALPQIGIITLATFVSFLINQQAFIFELALKRAILVFSALFGGLFIAWYMVFRLMKYFHFMSSRELAAKLTIYSSTPLYLVSFITALIPEFFFVHVFAIYCFYLSWTGIRDIPGPGSERKFAFSMIVGFAVLLIPYLIRGLLLNLITI